MNRIVSMLAIACMVFSSASRSEDTEPYKRAKNNGIKTCLTQLREVGNFIIEDFNHGSHDIWNSVNPDQSMFSSFVVKRYGDGESHIAITVGPDKSGKCYAEYRETAIWPKSCGVIRDEVWSKFKFIGSLIETTVVLKNDNKTVTVYLTPQSGGTSCLSTKREVIFY